MSGEKNNLTKVDALGKMCADIRDIAKEVAFGQIFFPNRANPSITCEVHNGLIKQIEILYPEKTVRYRSD